MEFEVRKKGKYEDAAKFVTKIREIQEKGKSSIRKSTRRNKEICK